LQEILFEVDVFDLLNCGSSCVWYIRRDRQLSFVDATVPHQCAMNLPTFSWATQLRTKPDVFGSENSHSRIRILDRKAHFVHLKSAHKIKGNRVLIMNQELHLMHHVYA